MYTTVGVHPTNTLQLEFPGGGDPRYNGDGGPEDEAAFTAAVLAVVAQLGEHYGTPPPPPSAHVPPPPPTSLDEYVAGLDAVIADGVTDGVVVAVGECGLDCDRTNWAPLEVQAKHFPLHFGLASRYNLPLFLHDRNTGGAFLSALAPHLPNLPRGGVVHSFTGTAEEAAAYLAAGLDIGINGCSLRAAESLPVVAGLPLHRLHLESDAPWCEMKASHASAGLGVSGPPPKSVHPEKKRLPPNVAALVKGRCEPAGVVRVAEVVGALLGVPPAEVAAVTTARSVAVFALT